MVEEEEVYIGKERCCLLPVVMDEDGVKMEG